jgi:hypothetical protein
MDQIVTAVGSQLPQDFVQRPGFRKYTVRVSGGVLNYFTFSADLVPSIIGCTFSHPNAMTIQTPHKMFNFL